MLSDSAILKKIERQPKRSAGFKQMVRELGVHGDARRELSERLKHLVARGQLQQIDSDRYAIPQPASAKNLAVGRLSMHRDGFGFVVPEADSEDGEPERDQDEARQRPSHVRRADRDERAPVQVPEPDAERERDEERDPERGG